MSLGKVLKNGIIDDNPTFVQVIGMCPTLAVTSSAINGIGMGLSTTIDRRSRYRKGRTHTKHQDENRIFGYNAVF